MHCLPPYSPDLNPIEQVFAKLKQQLRKVSKRTLDTLRTAIGEALNFFPPDECFRYLLNSGYAQLNRKTL
ncbi:hypothetical protein CCP3SC1AL1_70029 [Gammaproteobacteria bacterium]